jgi:aryl-alcohol dehydrogenase-like predicted oxidoreductase
MQTRRLGTSDMEITRVGFGAWAIGGGDYAFGWGPQDDRESIEAIACAVDAGVNWIDTAPVYGLGRSEKVVGQALKQLGPSRRPYVFTKCSLVWKEGERQVTQSHEAASIRKEVDASLRRLGVDVIDLVQVHWPKVQWITGPGTIEEAWGALVDLTKQGKIRHIGASNFSAADLEAVSAIAPVTSLQPPYSLLRRNIETEILPYCQSRDIGVIVYSPMQSGLLAGSMTKERVAKFPADDFRHATPEFQEPRLSKNLAFAALLGRIGARHGGPAGQVAVAWALRHPAVTAAIVGFRRPSQVLGLVGAADLLLSDEEVREIEAAIPSKA